MPTLTDASYPAKLVTWWFCLVGGWRMANALSFDHLVVHPCR
jgi:hypothetical protein